MKTFFQNVASPTGFRRQAKPIFLTLLLVCTGVLTGCLSRPSLNPQTFSFNSAAPAVTNAPAGRPVLGIKKLDVAAPFDDRSFVYRTGEFAYTHDPYARFLVAPGEELLAPLRAGLAGQGDFSTVVGIGSALKSDVLTEITISQLYGDFRQPNNPQAVLSVRFTFYNATNGVAVQSIFQKEYSRRQPIKPTSAAALMRGWNQALGEIVNEALADFRQAKSD
jgi:cholesterol transport system auxiliary component